MAVPAANDESERNQRQKFGRPDSSERPLKCGSRSSADLYRFFLSDSLADLERQLAGFLVGIDDYVIAVQNLAVEDFDGQRILNELLNCPLQGPCSKVRIVALVEQLVLRSFRKLDRNFAIGQQAAQAL